MIRTTAFCLCLSLLCAPAVQADITMHFVEGAPKDRFVLTNTGTCPIKEATITLDVGAAPAGLLFDTDPGGAGLEVSQPFEVIEGRNALLGLPELADGDTVLTLNMGGLPAGSTVSFSLDLDDSGTGRRTVVSGSEIAGSVVTLVFGTTTLHATFTDQASAIIPVAPCTS